MCAAPLAGVRLSSRPAISAVDARRDHRAREEGPRHCFPRFQRHLEPLHRTRSRQLRPRPCGCFLHIRHCLRCSPPPRCPKQPGGLQRRRPGCRHGRCIDRRRRGRLGVARTRPHIHLRVGPDTLRIHLLGNRLGNRSWPRRCIPLHKNRCRWPRSRPWEEFPRTRARNRGLPALATNPRQAHPGRLFPRRNHVIRPRNTLSK